MTTNIFKLGNSNAIRIPKPFIESMKLKTNDEIELILEQDKIVIKKINKNKSIKDLFNNYDKKYEFDNYLDDEIVGREEL